VTALLSEEIDLCLGRQWLSLSAQGLVQVLFAFSNHTNMYPPDTNMYPNYLLHQCRPKNVQHIVIIIIIIIIIISISNVPILSNFCGCRWSLHPGTLLVTPCHSRDMPGFSL